MVNQNDERRSQEVQTFWRRRSLRIDEILESWRTATSFAVMALKSAILLNGAAAVAILAFIASLYDGEKSKLAASLVSVLHHFLIGVFAAVVATAAAYFSAFSENRGLWYWTRNNKLAKLMDYGNYFFQILAIILVSYAYFRFWYGVQAGVNIMSPMTSVDSAINRVIIYLI